MLDLKINMKSYNKLKPQARMLAGAERNYF